MILDKEKNKIKPYYKDYRPLNVYKGKEKIAGYKITTVNNNSATFNNTYNDFIELSANGKAEQKQYEGYNLLENLLQTQTLNGVTFTVNEDKSVHVKGTASVRTEVNLWNKSSEKTFILKKGVIYYNNSNTTLYFHGSNGYFFIGNKQTYMSEIDINLNQIYIRVEASETVDKTIYPMISTKENLLDLSKTQTFTQYGKTVTIEDYKIKLTCENSTSIGTMCVKLTNGYDLSFNDGGAKWNGETFITAGDYTLSAKKITNIGNIFIKYKDNTFDLLLYGDVLNQTKKLQNKDIAYIIIQIGIENGQSGNNEFSNIQLIDNTIEKPYEPYCGGVPSPNLDYPQEIQVVDKVGVNVESINKNSKKTFTILPGHGPDVNLEYKDNALHILNGSYGYILIAPLYNFDEMNNSFFKDLKVGEEYTIGYMAKGISKNNILPTIYTDNFGDYSQIDNTNVLLDEKEYKFYYHVFTKKDKTEKLQIHLSANSREADLYIKDIFIAKGRHTEYSPYFSPVTKENILPTNEELVSLPNGVKDEIRENKIIKRIQKILINENSMPKNYIDLVGDYWKVNYNFSSDSKVKNVTLNTHKNYLCNRLNSKDIYWSWAINKKNWYLENNHLIFSIPKNIVESQVGATNKEKIANYLKANPIVFYAELEVPQEITIDKIKSLPLTTKVDIKANLNTEIAIKCKEME